MDQSSSNRKPVQQKKLKNNIISNEVRDYGNDPYFVKKADASQKFLVEHGFPEGLIKLKIEKLEKLLQ